MSKPPSTVAMTEWDGAAPAREQRGQCEFLMSNGSIKIGRFGMVRQREVEFDDGSPRRSFYDSSIKGWRERAPLPNHICGTPDAMCDGDCMRAADICDADLCDRCGHSYAQHSKGPVIEKYCLRCVCPEFRRSASQLFGERT